MPVPSATELGPSDGALAVFGRALGATALAMVLGGAVSMALLVGSASAGEVATSLGLGAVIGLGVALVVGLVSGFAAAIGRQWARRSWGRALGGAVALWALWVGLLAWVVSAWHFRLTTWDNVWPLLPPVVLGLVAALVVARWVHRTEDPLTPEQIAAAARAERRRRR